jgi:shikimate kinase
MTNLSNPRGVVLVGFMGAGKTSVGLSLSQRLGWHFQDLDSRIESRERRSIPEIFHELGEAAFRRAEQSALQELLSEMGVTPMVAALGGGTFVQADNFALIARAGVASVFLDAPVKELWLRCQSGDNSRPLRKDQNQFRQLYEARRPLYMKAGLCVDTSGKDVETVAREIAARLALHPEPKE